MLGDRNSSQRDEFYIRGKIEIILVYYISQSYFDLLRQNFRKNSDPITLFKQTLGAVQSIYYDVGAYDMLYSEFKKMCRKTWGEKYAHIYIDLTRDEKEGKYLVSMKAKTYILNVFAIVKLFD